MSLTFVIGRAGTGKTFHALKRAVDEARANPLGPPVWFLVPKQATFQTERELVARLGAFARIRVVDFERLGEAVLAETGGVAVPRVTDAGRRMIIGRLLYKHHDQLKYFASSARRPGLAGAIESLFDELEKTGNAIHGLGDVAGRLPSDPADGPPALAAKLADLRLLHDAYAEVVGSDRLDPARRREMVVERLSRAPSVRTATFLVDGFTEFSAAERQVLTTLAAGPATVEVSISMPPDGAVARGSRLPSDLSPFYKVEQTYLRLHAAATAAGVTIEPPVQLREPKRFCCAPLKRIERDLFAETTPAPSPPPYPEGERVGVRGGASNDVAKGDGSAIQAVPKAMTGNEAPTHARPLTPSLSPSEYRGGEGAGGDSTPAVTLFEAPDPRTEVQAVARRIRELLAAGYRQRDVLVLARDLDPYLHLVHAAFDEHDLAYFADRRRPATHHPLVILLRSAVRVAREGFTTSAISGVTKSGLAGVSRAEADKLENYLVEHGITSGGWRSGDHWKFKPRPAEEVVDETPALPAADAADGANVVAAPVAVPSRDAEKLRDHLREKLDPLVARLGRSTKAAPVREFVAEVVSTLERFGAHKELSQWIARDRQAAADRSGDADDRDSADAREALERAGEHEQVWKQLVGLFEEMVDVLGDEEVRAGEFVEIMESGLDAFDLAIAPQALDQVLVGSVDRTRPPPGVKAVFVLGLSRGTFPVTHRDDSLLSTPERRELRQMNVDVEAGTDRRQLDERWLAYTAFTRGSDKLVVSRPLADDAGRAREPSEYWSALRAIVPEATVAQESGCGGGSANCLSTPRDVVSALLAWARELPGTAAKTPDPGADAAEAAPAAPTPDRSAWTWQLFDWAARGGRAANRDLATLFDQAWPSLTYVNAARLSADVADRLFPSPMTVGAGQLESFAACPFQHFVKYGLRPATRGGGDIGGPDLSRVFREAMQQFVARRLATGFDADVDAATLADLAREAGGTLRAQVHVDEARNAYLLARVGRTLEMIVGTLREQLGRGEFKPRHVGMAFGPTASLKSPDLPLAGGKVLRLKGWIDRVDLAPDGGAAVFDYRMGEHKLSAASAYHGLSLRLLASLFVLGSARPKVKSTDKRLFPAAALTSRLLRSPQKVDTPAEAVDPTSAEFRLAAKPRGAIAASHAGRFDLDTKAGSSPVVSFWINKDGTFGRREQTDVTEDADFQTMVQFAGSKAAELAGEAAAGRVAVEPYLYQDTTPCVRCDYRKICRFEPSVNRYRKLEQLSRSDAVARMAATTVGTAGGRGNGDGE